MATKTKFLVIGSRPGSWPGSRFPKPIGVFDTQEQVDAFLATRNDKGELTVEMVPDCPAPEPVRKK